MFKVFDKKEKCWIEEDIYLSPNNDLFISAKTLFGTEKLHLVSDKRYICQQDVGLSDVYDCLIYEGDICKIEHLDVVGVVAYASEHASYYLFDDKNLKYYPLNEEYCKQMEIIGNVLEDNDLLIYEDEAESKNDVKEGE